MIGTTQSHQNDILDYFIYGRALTAAYSGSAVLQPGTSAPVNITVIDQRIKTVEAIGKFLYARSNQILTNGANESRQIDRLIEAQGAWGNGGTSNGNFASASALGTNSRLGFGPDAGDVSRLRTGGTASDRVGSPLPFSGRSWFDNGDSVPAPPVPGYVPQQPFINGGSINAGPVRLNGTFGGASSFGFSTSLRDIDNFAADPQAYGFGAATGRALSKRFNPFDAWIEGKYAHFRDGRSSADQDGHFGLVTAGADYVLSRRLLAGFLVQFDSTRQRSVTQQTEVSGKGWMAGPYATVRLSENLFWQARAAWGTSANEVSPFMTYTDKFDSVRWLASTTLAGRWAWGPWMLRPAASVAYMADTAKGYSDSFGVWIPDVTAKLGQAKAGPEVSYRHRLNPYIEIEPRAQMQLIWNFTGAQRQPALARSMAT